MRIKQRRTHGIALISVMVVVAVVSASAAQLLYRQNIDVERSARIMSREQAFLFAFGLETYARQLLDQDKNKYDYYFEFAGYEEGDPRYEVWSWPIPNREMPDEWLDTFRRAGVAHLEARIRDLSGLFNLNNVHRAILLRQKPGEPGPLENMYERTFKALVNASFGNDLTPPDADALWDALVDWFDDDEEGAAEDEEYLGRDVPYLTGQRRMAWPEEIRLIRGFDGRVSERLLPLFSALPHPDIVRMNINTVKGNLLRYIPGLDDSGLSGEILTRRSDEMWFSSKGAVGRFLATVLRDTPTKFTSRTCSGFLTSKAIFSCFPRVCVSAGTVQSRFRACCVASVLAEVLAEKNRRTPAGTKWSFCKGGWGRAIIVRVIAGDVPPEVVRRAASASGRKTSPAAFEGNEHLEIQPRGHIDCLVAGRRRRRRRLGAVGANHVLPR